MRSTIFMIAFVAIGCGKVEVQADAQVCTMATCNDDNACTIDTCGASGCTHAAVQCDDFNDCTVDACDMVLGCTHTSPPGSMVLAYTATMQSFTVPTCVTLLHITAEGAQGGNSNDGQLGGMGASIKGDFQVVPGDVLTILVGGAGIDGSTTVVSQRGGTGGGGTFVVKGSTILVIAGGGGGAIGGLTFGSAPGGPGQITPEGQAGSPAGFAGGVAGGGGTSSNNTAYHGGTGGGGYSGDGVGNSTGSATYGTPNTPGKAFLNGGNGGTGGSQGRNGGYGGGGSGGYSGAGGGGYSGGGAGQSVETGTAPYCGGGGGSLNNGTNQVNTAGARSGNGQVTITW